MSDLSKFREAVEYIHACHIEGVLDVAVRDVMNAKVDEACRVAYERYTTLPPGDAKMELSTIVNKIRELRV